MEDVTIYVVNDSKKTVRYKTCDPKQKSYYGYNKSLPPNKYTRVTLRYSRLYRDYEAICFEGGHMVESPVDTLVANLTIKQDAYGKLYYEKRSGPLE